MPPPPTLVTRTTPLSVLMMEEIARTRRRSASTIRGGQPFWRETPVPSLTLGECRAARDAMADPRSDEDRVLDVIVNRLMCVLAN